MNEQDIKQRIKQQSIYNAGGQGITYTEPPTWISTTSWWIGGVVAFITFFAFLANVKSNDGVNVFGAFFCALFYGFILKGLSRAIFYGIYHGGRYAKQGAIAATKEGSKLLDNATAAVAKKITIAVEKGKAEAKLEQEKQEKQKLKERVTDLELQYLRQRIDELEKKYIEKE